MARGTRPTHLVKIDAFRCLLTASILTKSPTQYEKTRLAGDKRVNLYGTPPAMAARSVPRGMLRRKPRPGGAFPCGAHPLGHAPPFPDFGVAAGRWRRGTQAHPRPESHLPPSLTSEWPLAEGGTEPGPAPNRGRPADSHGTLRCRQIGRGGDLPAPLPFFGCRDSSAEANTSVSGSPAVGKLRKDSFELRAGNFQPFYRVGEKP